jgi:hypothetical protein
LENGSTTEGLPLFCQIIQEIVVNSIWDPTKNNGVTWANKLANSLIRTISEYAIRNNASIKDILL